MLVAEAENPVKKAIDVRRRWRYILGVARGAQKGLVLDGSLPEVMREHERYARRAEAIIAALDEWLEEQAGRPLSDPN